VIAATTASYTSPADTVKTSSAGSVLDFEFGEGQAEASCPALPADGFWWLDLRTVTLTKCTLPIAIYLLNLYREPAYHAQPY
jgi:hypothetical protein